MSYEIDMNFQKALQQARALDEVANKMKTTSESFDDTMEQLSNDWKSDNSAAFYQKGDRINSNILVTAQNLERIAANIRQAAERIYEAEKAAEELANARNS